jgi:hypothetical protein
VVGLAGTGFGGFCSHFELFVTRWLATQCGGMPAMFEFNFELLTEGYQSCLNCH